MNDRELDPESLAAELAEDDAVEAAVRDAVRDALRMHKRLGHTIVSWQNGKVVWIPPDQIDVEDDEPPTAQAATDDPVQ